MRAEIIAIGDELTSGQRLDTNSQWLSERLGELGVQVAFHTTVGDDLEDNVAVFRTAIDRADIVVATGGLGPTADDLTRDAIAAAAGVELVRRRRGARAHPQPVRPPRAARCRSGTCCRPSSRAAAAWCRIRTARRRAST